MSVRFSILATAGRLSCKISPNAACDLADAFMETYDRGRAWKEAIRKSIGQIEVGVRQRVQSAFADGIRKLERETAEYDLKDMAAVQKA
jgi:hypothetical protein